MHCAPRIALVTLFLVASTTVLDLHADEVFGSLTLGIHHSAAQESDFPCAFVVPFPPILFRADQSHATISNSGNQTLHCSGKLPSTGEQYERFELEGFPCVLHYDSDDDADEFNDITRDSRFSVNPSGHVNLMCKSQR